MTSYLRKTKVPVPECLKPWLPEQCYHTLRLGVSYMDSFNKEANERMMLGSVDIFLIAKSDGCNKYVYYEPIYSKPMWAPNGCKDLVDAAKQTAKDENFLIEVVGEYLDKRKLLLPVRA